MTNNTKTTNNKINEANETTREKNADTTFTRKLKPPENTKTPLKITYYHIIFKGAICPFRVHPH